MGWVYNSSDNYPTNENFIPLPEKDMAQPYPTSLWRIIGDKVYHLLYPSLPEKSMVSPYPNALWRIENNSYPFALVAPEPSLLGAFANATHLHKISIPKSVKKIGTNAFTNTQLSQVTIASDCEYYDTSFPTGCVITFYPD